MLVNMGPGQVWNKIRETTGVTFLIGIYPEDDNQYYLKLPDWGWYCLSSWVYISLKTATNIVNYAFYYPTLAIENIRNTLQIGI